MYTFLYLVKQGFKNILSHKAMSTASIIIVTFTMFIYGLFIIAGENLKFNVTRLQSLQKIQIFLKKSVTPAERKVVEDELLVIKEIQSFNYESEEDALNNMKEYFGEKGYLLNGLEGANNPLAASYVIQLYDISKSKDVVNKLKIIPNVDNVEYKAQTIQTLETIVNIIKLVAQITAGILLIISIFIISNTIKLGLYSRRKEISIMKYIGATDDFVRFPFIVEGLIIGASGSILALAFVYLAYTAMVNKVYATFLFMLSSQLVKFLEFRYIIFPLVGSYLILGIVIGMIGSLLSIRKYLKV